MSKFHALIFSVMILLSVRLAQADCPASHANGTWVATKSCTVNGWTFSACDTVVVSANSCSTIVVNGVMGGAYGTYGGNPYVYEFSNGCRIVRDASYMFWTWENCSECDAQWVNATYACQYAVDCIDELNCNGGGDAEQEAISDGGVTDSSLDDQAVDQSASDDTIDDQSEAAVDVGDRYIPSDGDSSAGEKNDEAARNSGCSLNF